MSEESNDCLERVRSVFGRDVELHNLPPVLWERGKIGGRFQGSRVEGAKLRREADRQVRGCTRCRLRDVCRAPVPAKGPTVPQFAVLGEAPGTREDLTGEPFVGPSGKLLRRLMGEAGLEEDDALFVNTVSCHPDRKPRSDEVQACTDNLHAQLDRVAGPWLLALGGTALNTIHPDLKITEREGKWMVWGRWWVLTLRHPAAILRARNTRTLREETLAGIEKFAQVVAGERDPLKYVLTEGCVKCGKRTNLTYDAWMLGWCNKHKSLGRKAQDKERKRHDDSQGKLF